MVYFARGQILQTVHNLFEVTDNIGANAYRWGIDGYPRRMWQNSSREERFARQAEGEGRLT